MMNPTGKAFVRKKFLPLCKILLNIDYLFSKMTKVLLKISDSVVEEM